MENKKYESAINSLEDKIEEALKSIRHIKESYENSNYEELDSDNDYLETVMISLEDRFKEYNRAVDDYNDFLEEEENKVKEIVSIEKSREMIDLLAEKEVKILMKNDGLKADIERGGAIDSSGFRGLITVASLEWGDEVEWALLANMEEENIRLAKELMKLKSLEPTEECTSMVKERFAIGLTKDAEKQITIEALNEEIGHDDLKVVEIQTIPGSDGEDISYHVEVTDSKQNQATFTCLFDPSKSLIETVVNEFDETEIYEQISFSENIEINGDGLDM